MEPRPPAELRRVWQSNRSLVVVLPADLVRELRILKREYAIITRAPGRGLLVEFAGEPWAPADARGDLDHNPLVLAHGLKPNILGLDEGGIHAVG